MAEVGLVESSEDFVAVSGSDMREEFSCYATALSDIPGGFAVLHEVLTVLYVVLTVLYVVLTVLYVVMTALWLVLTVVCVVLTV